MVVLSLLAAATLAARGQAATTTTLAITSSGGEVTTVTQGSVVTLTATVVAGSTPVTIGQVNFCVVSSTAACTDIHLLATAQLTSAGTAVYKFRPSAGGHTYKAVFLGTPHGTMQTSGSFSAAAALTVTSTLSASATQLLESPQNSPDAPYPLTVAVTGTGSAPPTGTISLVDQNDDNAVVGTATLADGQAQISLLNTPTNVTANLSAGSTGVGDFNGDGSPDLAIGIPIPLPPGSPSEVEILLGNGNSSFTASSFTTPDLNHPSFFTADFNGDGNLDLALTTNADDLCVYLGNGDGTFATPAATCIPGVDRQYNVAIADFNQDGIPDLAVLGQNGGNTVTILLGNGDGTFTATTTGPISNGDQAIVAGDFNGDGIPDLVVLARGSSVVSSPTTLAVLLGNGDGTFQQPASLVVTNSQEAWDLVAADFNGDGNLDLAVSQQHANPTNSGDTPDSEIAVLLGDGHGGFTAPPTYVPLQVNEGAVLAVADFDQDGNADLLTSSASNSSHGPWLIIPGNGDGTFSTSAEASALALSDASIDSINGLPAIADFSGDGYPDVANAYGVLTLWTVGSQIASATVTTPLDLPLGSGEQSIIASYPGDSIYAPSTSAPLLLTVPPLTPTIVVTPSSSTITPSQTVTLAITVSGPAGDPTPSGSVKIASAVNGNSDYASASFPLVNGTASITIPANSLSLGQNIITVSFLTADPNLYAFLQASATLAVTGPAGFTLGGTPITVPMLGAGGSSTITVTPANGFTGTVALTCAVTNNNSTITSGQPTCSVASSVAITGTSAATTTLNIGTTINGTLAGSYTVTVSGTSGSIASSTPVSLSVTAPAGTATPSITATPTSTTIADNQSDTVTVTVAGGSGSPTGYVAIYSGTFYIQQQLSSGSAALTIPAVVLIPGANTFTAIFTGDSNYRQSSTTFTITVIPFNISTSTPAPVTAGGTATSTVTLNAGAGYSGKLNLICALTQSPSGAQHLPSCSLSPTSVQLAAGGSGTTTLSVTTTPATTTTGALAKPHLWGLAGGVAFAGLLLFGLPIRRKYWQLMLVLCALTGLLMTSCGGGNSGSTTPPPVTNPGTTAGNYVFTVTGTDSSNANTKLSVNVTMTVQ